jgi:hypothetical protein
MNSLLCIYLPNTLHCQNGSDLTIRHFLGKFYYDLKESNKWAPQTEMIVGIQKRERNHQALHEGSDDHQFTRPQTDILIQAAASWTGKISADTQHKLLQIKCIYNTVWDVTNVMT